MAETGKEPAELHITPPWFMLPPIIVLLSIFIFPMWLLAELILIDENLEYPTNLPHHPPPVHITP